ncbi:type IX secretion system membrane protein PorP/SprF [Bacteroidota bacterium]
MRHFIFILFLLVITRNISAQDPQFTQFYANPLYLAPSFAGAIESDRIATVYRNQWATMPGAFVTASFSYDHFFEKFNSGLGVLLTRDVAGSGGLALTNAGIQYAYEIKVNQLFYIRPGIHVNYTQMGIDYQKLQWNSTLTDPVYGESYIPQQGREMTADMDVSSSVLAYSDRYWFGFAIDHLLTPNYGLWNNDAELAMRYSAFGGYQIYKRGKLLSPVDETLSAAFYYRHQDRSNQLDLGLYWYKAPVILGVWYRGIPLISDDPRGDAIAFLIGYKNDGIRVGYSYDFTISNMISSTGGSHEISVIYNFSFTTNKKTKRLLPCSEF